MGIISGGGGGTFNGGTITNPLIIDVSGKADNVQALRVKYPETLDFTTKPFQFEVVNVGDLFAMTTTGKISTAGNGLITDNGSISTTAGLIYNSTAYLGTSIGFFDKAPTAGAAQTTLVSGTATPEQITVALQSLGLAGGT